MQDFELQIDLEIIFCDKFFFPRMNLDCEAEVGLKWGMKQLLSPS